MRSTYIAEHFTRSPRAAWGAWLALSLTIAGVLLFYRLGEVPIQVWDEGRLANNALEMSQDGFSLITTYDGKPDHWNTKPPLQIWAMAAAIRAFGPSEWSIRFPSALAGLLTTTVVFWFCAARLKRPAIAFAAVLAILGSPGYVQGTDFWTNPGELVQGHAARSGNYDATLTLFTTTYLLAAYQLLSYGSAVRWRWLLICSAGVVLAFLTKTIQALIFLPAVVAFALATGQAGRLVRSREVWICVLCALIVCVGYYLARESIDPGYIESALTYDFGRYAAVSDGHDGRWYHYLAQFRLFPTLLPFLAIGAAQAIADRGERRKLSAFVALTSAFYVASISSSATKLWWYAIPLVPMSAIALALALDFAIDRLSQRPYLRKSGGTSAGVLVVCTAVSVLIVFRNLQLQEMGIATAQSRPEDFYSEFLRGPVTAASDIGKFAVLHPGYSRDVYYVAPTLFYVNILRGQGRSIVIQLPEEPVPAGFDTVIICSGEIGRVLSSGIRLLPILEESGCGVYRLV